MRKAAGFVASLIVVSSAFVLVPAATAQAAGLSPSVAGQWTTPFEESNAAYPIAAGPTEHCNQIQDPQLGPYLVCKPAAAATVVLPNGRVLYWNNLQGTENQKLSIVIEGGLQQRNDSSRVLDLSGATPTFTTPSPSDGGGVNPLPGTGPPWPLPGNNGFNDNPQGSSDMFCADQLHLANGKVLIAGGTAWYQQPPIPGTNYGIAELAGIRSVRVFDPATNTYSNVSPMNYARWYPTLIELGDGRVFVGGGVRKLIQTDGINVRNTEIYDPNAGPGGTWTDNGASGATSLPLFPRLNLLPNGSIYYGGVGQMWGPAGQSVDELLYVLRQSYSPSTNSWTPYGFGVLGARSGAYSMMLPLKAPYTHADILTGGGTLGPPPGSYLANNLTEITHLDASNNWAPTYQLGPTMNRNRWYGTAVTLPNDAVAVFSGADKDEVIDPASESPVRTAEWYTPWDGQFHPLSDASRDRTYHNTAVLLPDGSVLVGGHAPIDAHYLTNSNVQHDITAGTPFETSNNFRDPSLEIFRPPYMFNGARPSISSVQSGIAYNTSFAINTPDAATISSVRLIRLPADTHVVDGNMRSVELPIVSRTGSSVTVSAPPTGNVAPPGPYYLFINRGTGASLVPSTAAMVSMGSTTDSTPAIIPNYASTSAMGTTTSQIGPGTGTNALQQLLPTLPALPLILPSLLAQKVESVPGMLAMVMIAGIAIALAVAPPWRRGRWRLAMRPRRRGP